MLGHCHLKCKITEIDPEYTGKDYYIKYLDFNSLYSSDMVQALPTGEITVCDSVKYASSSFSTSTSSSNIRYICDNVVKYNDEFKQKTKKYPFFPGNTRANNDQFTDYQKEN